MKVTVAIITRNRANQLKRCLLSLTKQTAKDFSVLVVDNGSTDNTKNVVDSFKNELRIKYCFEKQPGAAYARNKALRLITGDIMATIDDDCESSSDWVKSIIKAHLEFPDAAVIQGWAISKPKGKLISIVEQFNHEAVFKDNIVRKKNFLYHLNRTFLRESGCRILLIDGKNASFKLEIFKKNHLEFNIDWARGDDFEFSKQILSLGESIIFDPKIVIYHWERPTLLKFISQRFGSGAQVVNAKFYWPSVYFPQRKPLWWVGRGINFLIYLVRDGYIYQSPILIPLFIIERVTTISGRLFQHIKLRVV